MKSTILKSISTAIFALTVQFSMAQTASISGKIISEGKPIEFANVGLVGTSTRAATDTSGIYTIRKIPTGNYIVRVS
jgi:outer membrane receptor for ferrienterochelin and colicins